MPDVIDTSAWTGRTWDNRLVVTLNQCNFAILWLRRDWSSDPGDMSQAWGFEIGQSLYRDGYGVQLSWKFHRWWPVFIGRRDIVVWKARRYPPVT